MAQPSLLSLGLEHHREGRLAQAATVYQRILTEQPNHPDALHLLGVVRRQQFQDSEAVVLIERAVALRPDSPSFHCNLADVQRALGRLQEAEASCRTALALQPDYPQALHNLGVILFKLGRYAEAETAYRDALRSRPDSGATLSALADVLREQGRVAAALATYERALTLAPQLHKAHGNYGLLLVQRGELDRGLDHCRKAVELKPDEPLAHHNLGRLLLEYGRIDEALDELAEALELAPDSAALCLSIGQAWTELADYGQARGWLERALALDPTLTEARCHIGFLFLEAGNPEAALDVYRGVLEKEPERAEAHIGLARARLEQGDVAGAVTSHREALRLRPEAAGLHAALGHTLANAGDLEEAVVCHRRALGLNPCCIPAFSGLASITRGQTTDEELVQIERLLVAPWMTDLRRSALHFGLAQVSDGRGDWTHAAQHLADANALQKKHDDERDLGYDPAEFRGYIDRLIAAFTPAHFERVRGLGSASRRPLFVVGMPRSGTTLAEQILASHPQVYGAGERRFATLGFGMLPRVLQIQAAPTDCLHRLDRPLIEQFADWHLERLRELDGGGFAHVVDKMPDNYSLLGWLVTLFPQARFIHCRRDVRDVALSCWSTNFSRIRWANDLEHLAERINDYLRIMDHWRKVLPVAVFQIDYEQLVADQERTTRRLLDFVGLEWDPACLSFHKTERLVRTASVAQVRQPIYQRSVARWKHYEAALRPLLARLSLPTAHPG